MVLLLALALGAAPPADDPGAIYQRLRKEFFTATGRFITSDAVKTYAPRFFAHADRYPNDASAIEALLLFASLSDAKSEVHQKATHKLQNRYVRRSVVEPLLRNLGLSNGTFEKQFLRDVAEKNPDKRVRALAWRAAVNGQSFYLSDDKRLLANEKVRKLPADLAARLKGDVARREKEIAEARDKLKSPELAGALADVSVGAKAPATEAIDLDGKKTSLADHKGKVILLDFWFTDCGPCKRMIPGTNALVKEMKGRPFVPVSVSTDADKEMVVAFKKQTEMLGEAWWVGRGSRVLETWDVEAYPTVYVIDHEGVIRHHQVGYDAKDDKIPDLVRELVKRAEAKKPR